MVKMEEKINLLGLCSPIRRECVPAPCQNPLPALHFSSQSAMGDESLHDCLDRGPEAGDDRSFPLRLPREAATPYRPEQI